MLIKYGYLPKGTYDETSEVVADAVERFADFMQVKTQSVNPFTIQRCGCPDFAADGTGSGSWPSGCHPSWPNNHAVSYQVNKARMPGFLNDVFERSWDLCAQAYADIGMVLVREDSNPKANSYVTWERGNGWIGLATVPRNPRCSARIFAKFSWGYEPRDLVNQWARLLAHELGHNMSMSHTRGGIMNPSIIGGVFTPTAWRGDPAFNTLKRYFGGEPVQGKPPIWTIPQPEQQ